MYFHLGHVYYVLLRTIVLSKTRDRPIDEEKNESPNFFLEILPPEWVQQIIAYREFIIYNTWTILSDHETFTWRRGDACYFSVLFPGSVACSYRTVKLVKCKQFSGHASTRTRAVRTTMEIIMYTVPIVFRLKLSVFVILTFITFKTCKHNVAC